MAGSYRHVVDERGRLLEPEDLVGMLESGGDVYEAVEEMYGMIWMLAEMATRPPVTAMVRAEAVAHAQEQYEVGLNLSPLAD